jgi:hypothetical protein
LAQALVEETMSTPPAVVILAKLARGIGSVAWHRMLPKITSPLECLEDTASVGQSGRVNALVRLRWAVP